jgi:hypothetical protein
MRKPRITTTISTSVIKITIMPTDMPATAPVERPAVERNAGKSIRHYNNNIHVV